MQHLAQRMRSARHRRWTKRGDAELRKSLRNRGNRVPTVERVETIEPMNVNVDETGKHDMPGQIDRTCRTCRIAPIAPIAPCSDIDNPFAIDDEGATRLHTSGQDEIGARQDDHER